MGVGVVCAGRGEEEKRSSVSARPLPESEGTTRLSPPRLPSRVTVALVLEELNIPYSSPPKMRGWRSLVSEK